MGSNQSENDRRPYDSAMNRDDSYADATGHHRYKRDDDDIDRSGGYRGRDDPRGEYDNDRNKQQSSGGSFLTDNPIAHGIGMTSSLFKGKDKSDDDRQQQPRDDPSGSASASRDYGRGRDDSYGASRSGYGASEGGSFTKGSDRSQSYAGGASYGQERDDAYAGSSGSQGYGSSSATSRSGYAGDDSTPSGYGSTSSDAYGRSGTSRNMRNDDRY